MIYTVTLNPALDRAVQVEKLISDDANRVESEERYAGGKGIDASRVIKVLGGDTVALGFIGGFHGMELEQRLLRQGVNCDFVETRGETRTNILIFEKDKKSHTSLNASGPDVNEVEVRELIEKLKKLDDPDYIIVSGSVPKGVPKDIYGEIIAIAKAKGAITALDADGEVMMMGIESVPFIIKPNLYEIARLLDRKVDGVKDAVSAATEMRERGINIVIVSMGGDGAVVVSDGIRLLGIPPKVEVVSTVGAGDSFLAAFVLGHSRKMDIRDCLRLGVAAGAAASMTPGTELARKKDVDEILPRVVIEEV